MSNRMIRGRADVAMDIVVYVIMILMSIIFLYPVVYAIANSFSGADAVLRREVWLWPVDFTLQSYKLVMEHQYVLPAYWNTILYTVLGTAYSRISPVAALSAVSQPLYAGHCVYDDVQRRTDSDLPAGARSRPGE